MNKQLILRKKLTKARVRARISGTATRPRLSVRISNTQVVAQLIDDASAKTLASATSVGQKSLEKKTMTEKSVWVGEQIAKSAEAVKITTVVFDRGFRMYHGRVKQLAEAARLNGLKF
ncbi:50S ribosomal protein L18 [Candidatus Saccharibacteria bacterium]|nr:50S ribosomal protein L18 [Candidatus Saccharibacteria bacterium]